MKEKINWAEIFIAVIIAVAIMLLIVRYGDNRPWFSPEGNVSKEYGYNNTPIKNATIIKFPDLIVESMNYLSTNVTNGTIVTVTANIKNIGQANAGASYAHLEILQTGSYSNIWTRSLRPGESYSVQANFTLQKNRQYTAIGLADWFNSVRESDENNNYNNITIRS